MKLEFDEVAVETIQRLMSLYDESAPETVVARALGLMETVRPFIKRGELTVVDYNKAPEEEIVLLFESVRRKAAA